MQVTITQEQLHTEKNHVHYRYVRRALWIPSLLPDHQIYISTMYWNAHATALWTGNPRPALSPHFGRFFENPPVIHRRGHAILFKPYATAICRHFSQTAPRKNPNHDVSCHYTRKRLDFIRSEARGLSKYQFFRQLVITAWRLNW